MSRENSQQVQNHIQVFFDNSTDESRRQEALQAICNYGFTGKINAFQLTSLINQLTSHLQDEQLRSNCALLLGQLYLGKFAEGKLSPVGIMAPNRAHTAAYYFQRGMQYGDIRCATMFTEAFKEKRGCLAIQPKAWDTKIKEIMKDSSVQPSCKQILVEADVGKKTGEFNKLPLSKCWGLKNADSEENEKTLSARIGQLVR